MTALNEDSMQPTLCTWVALVEKIEWLQPSSHNGSTISMTEIPLVQRRQKTGILQKEGNNGVSNIKHSVSNNVNYILEIQSLLLYYSSITKV
jgi:hypothetical protein